MSIVCRFPLNSSKGIPSQMDNNGQNVANVVFERPLS